MRAARLTMLLVLGLLACPGTRPVRAEVTPEQRRELTELKKELGQVSRLLREKKLDEIDTLLQSAEEKLNAIATAADVEANDRGLLGVANLIKRHRDTVARLRARAAGPGAGGVSFSKDVAPLIADACLDCHGANNPRANLRLDTFAGWERGGRSGPLLVVGRANNSRLLARLTAPNADQRMPRNADPLPAEQLETIGNWVNQGAKYDGERKDVALADLVEAASGAGPVVIPKPKGNEKVSFTRDIAPFMANLCGGCHSRARKSGGLCLESFHDLMRGGDSGEVVIPGDRENSRLFRLVGGLENPRMPQGQARITRKNYEDLKTWFDEGCTYDGTDPKTSLRTFVRTEADKEADRFAALSPREFNAHRTQRSAEQFQRALPNDASESRDSDDFHLIGNVSSERLKQVEEWAQAQAALLRKQFAAGQGPLWKGRLAVFVLKDRFSYDEFNLVIDKREAPREMTAHSVVSANQEDAYVVLFDGGDESAPGAGGLRVHVIDQLTQAFLKRSGARLPDWLLRGTGLALAGQVLRGDPSLRALKPLAKQHAAKLNRPEDVFAEAALSPETTGPVGYALVEFLLEHGGPEKFAQFVVALQSGSNTAEAVRAIYGSDLTGFARSYVASLR